MTDPNSEPAKVLVAYYSATGHVHALAKAVAQGAREAGAEVRVRHVEELAPELLISQNQAWGRHRSEVGEEPTATLADLEWADGMAFGTPTRFGNAAAQLKMFLDEASTILALNNTLYHWGAIVLPLGYTVREAFNGGGNTYGASYTSGTRIGEPDPDTRAVAMARGGRLARVASVIASAQITG
jgi:NAD(P)H dehydrogenase (quinone)